MPQDTTPMRVYLPSTWWKIIKWVVNYFHIMVLSFGAPTFVTNGPPESPWQESFPAAPAHIIWLVISFWAYFPQLVFLKTWTVTSCKTFGEDPPYVTVPHPDTTAVNKLWNKLCFQIITAKIKTYKVTNQLTKDMSVHLLCLSASEHCCFAIFQK